MSGRRRVGGVDEGGASVLGLKGLRSSLAFEVMLDWIALFD